MPAILHQHAPGQQHIGNRPQQQGSHHKSADAPDYRLRHDQSTQPLGRGAQYLLQVHAPDAQRRQRHIEIGKVDQADAQDQDSDGNEQKQLRTAAALINITLIPEVDAGQRHQFDGRKPVSLWRKVEMGVELIGDSLRVAGIVKQQIADKVGPTVLPFLDIAYGQVQIIP